MAFLVDQCKNFHKNGGFPFCFCTKTELCEQGLSVTLLVVFALTLALFAFLESIKKDTMIQLLSLLVVVALVNGKWIHLMIHSSF